MSEPDRHSLLNDPEHWSKQAADMRKLEGSWERAGIAVERFSTKWENPTVGLRGFGGPVTSIGYVSYYGGYRITGASKCAPGNALELSD